MYLGAEKYRPGGVSRVADALRHAKPRRVRKFPRHSITRDKIQSSAHAEIPSDTRETFVDLYPRKWYIKKSDEIPAARRISEIQFNKVRERKFHRPLARGLPFSTLRCTNAFTTLISQKRTHSGIPPPRSPEYPMLKHFSASPGVHRRAAKYTSVSGVTLCTSFFAMYPRNVIIFYLFIFFLIWFLTEKTVFVRKFVILTS